MMSIRKLTCWITLIVLLFAMEGIALGDSFDDHPEDSAQWYDGNLYASDRGLSIHMEPSSRILSDGEKIEVTIRFVGDTDMPEHVTGFDVRIGGGLYSSTFGEFDPHYYNCEIPGSDWRKYISSSAQKIPVYAVVYTTDGNAYRKETFYVHPDSREKCRKHKWTFHESDDMDIIGYLYCSKCGEIGDAFYLQRKESDKLSLAFVENPGMDMKEVAVDDVDYILSPEEAKDLLNYIYGKTVVEDTLGWKIAGCIFLAPWMALQDKSPRYQPSDEVSEYYQMLTGEKQNGKDVEQIKRSFIIEADMTLSSRKEIDYNLLNKCIQRLDKLQGGGIDFDDLRNSICESVKQYSLVPLIKSEGAADLTNFVMDGDLGLAEGLTDFYVTREYIPSLDELLNNSVAKYLEELDNFRLKLSGETPEKEIQYRSIADIDIDIDSIIAQNISAEMLSMMNAKDIETYFNCLKTGTTIINRDEADIVYQSWQNNNRVLEDLEATKNGQNKDGPHGNNHNLNNILNAGGTKNDGTKSPTRSVSELELYGIELSRIERSITH